MGLYFRNTLFIIFSYFSVSGQVARGLCDSTKFEKGAFDLSTTSLCLPNTLTLTDKSGGSNVRYVFDYQSESFESASANAVNTTSYSYQNLSVARKVTVLQLGLKNGKTMAACNTLIVRPSNVPHFSYSVCGSNRIFINIPKDEVNDFDTYAIELGAGINPVFTDKNSLPFEISQNLSLPRSFRITASYANTTKNCPNPIPYFNVVPNSNTAAGNTHSFLPNISNVELVSPTLVKIDYEGPYPGLPAFQFDLLSYEKGNNVNNNQTRIANLNPGTHYLPLADSKSYCFFAQRKDLCGSITPEKSADVCTQILTSVVFSPLKHDITWEKYPIGLHSLTTPSLPFLGINLIRNQKLEIVSINKVAQNASSNIIAQPLAATTAINDPIDCKVKYCYRVIEEINGTFLFNQFKGKSYSNQICIDREIVRPPALTDLWVSTNLLNKNEVSFENTSTWTLPNPPGGVLPIKEIVLYKSDSLTYKAIDSVAQGIKIMKDPADATKSMSYKIAFKDACNSLSELSKEVKSIYLNYTTPSLLKWNADVPFSSVAIKKYDVIPLHETTQAQLTPILVNKSTTQKDVDLDPYELKAYFILKISSEGTPERVSYSNIVTLPVSAGIYIPTAFTPNGDGVNDNFGILGKTKRLKDFKFSLYNRFGEPIVELFDANSKWDGNVNGKPVQSGTYNFIITAQSDLGIPIIQKGVLEIVR